MVNYPKEFDEALQTYIAAQVALATCGHSRSQHAWDSLSLGVVPLCPAVLQDLKAELAWGKELAAYVDAQTIAATGKLIPQ